MTSNYARRSPSGVDGAPLARTAPRPTVDELEARVRFFLPNNFNDAAEALSDLAARAKEAEELRDALLRAQPYVVYAADELPGQRETEEDKALVANVLSRSTP